MSKVKYIHLKEICDVNQGLQIPISKRYKNMASNRYFYITIQFLKDNIEDRTYIENPPKSTICKRDDILITRTGSTGKVITNVEGCFHNNFFKINYDKSKIYGKYLYYCLTSKEKQKEMNTRAGITTIPDLNHFMFLDIKIPYFNLDTQKKIASILSTIDKKIEINNKINQKLEAMAKTLYDYWFIQFDFPNSEGKPYKSSGGKMVYSEELKREIPEGWKIGKLEDIVNIFDAKRIPLSKQERGKRQGKYPYYGATSIMDYIDDYIFDGDYILLAEDGSIMDDKGFPIIQYIWGKTWVNNHAHVLSAKDKFNNEFLFQFLKMISVVQIMTGSIQKKINQENLLSVNIFIPKNNLLKKFANFSIPIRKKLINNIEENQKLTKLRDWLLPMLMNGQVRIK